MKTAMTSKLEKLSETFPMMQPSWVPHHLPGVDGVDGVAILSVSHVVAVGGWFHVSLDPPGKIQDVHYVRNFLETGTQKHQKHTERFDEVKIAEFKTCCLNHGDA